MTIIRIKQSAKRSNISRGEIKKVSLKDELLNIDKKQFTQGICKDCIYKKETRNSYSCNYITETGKRRNSMPPHCNKYRSIKAVNYNVINIGNYIISKYKQDNKPLEIEKIHFILDYIDLYFRGKYNRKLFLQRKEKYNGVYLYKDFSNNINYKVNKNYKGSIKDKEDKKIIDNLINNLMKVDIERFNKILKQKRKEVDFIVED